jgi:hypothetical protein
MRARQVRSGVSKVLTARAVSAAMELSTRLIGGTAKSAHLHRPWRTNGIAASGELLDYHFTWSFEEKRARQVAVNGALLIEKHVSPRD